MKAQLSLELLVLLVFITSALLLEGFTFLSLFRSSENRIMEAKFDNFCSLVKLRVKKASFFKRSTLIEKEFPFYVKDGILVFYWEDKNCSLDVSNFLVEEGENELILVRKFS